jgi:microcystin-dependent protein
MHLTRFAPPAHLRRAVPRRAANAPESAQALEAPQELQAAEATLSPPDTLLTYAVEPAPLPLQVSPESGAPRLGALTIVVSNNGAQPVTVESLDFTIVVGTPDNPDALSLTDVDGGFGLEVQGGAWTFVHAGNGRFTATPPADAEITTQGISFTISNIQVSRRVGTSPLTLTERAAVTGDVPADRTAVALVSKFPYGFFAGDLSASMTLVQFGHDAVLTWRGSNAEYLMRWDGREEALGNVRSWTTPPLERATTFVLVVRAQEHGSSVEEHFAITLIVSNPSVLAHDITVQGPTTLQGPLQSSAGASFGGDVRASGLVIDATGVVFPRGGIILWAGSTDNVPPGWVLCNGHNGTPDLRGRFVVGWHPDDGDYNGIGRTGGASYVTLQAGQMPAHAHDGQTGGAGSHQHWIEGTDANGLAWRSRRIPGETTVDMGYGGGSNRDPGGDHWRGAVNTDEAGWHVHGFSTNAAGGNQAHENRPPYLVVAYIMKT